MSEARASDILFDFVLRLIYGALMRFEDYPLPDRWDTSREGFIRAAEKAVSDNLFDGMPYRMAAETFLKEQERLGDGKTARHLEGTPR
jgi:hypothetical protein